MQTINCCHLHWWARWLDFQTEERRIAAGLSPLTVTSRNIFDADAQGGSQGPAFSAGPLVHSVPTKGSEVELGFPLPLGRRDTVTASDASQVAGTSRTVSEEVGFPRNAAWSQGWPWGAVQSLQMTVYTSVPPLMKVQLQPRFLPP